MIALQHAERKIPELLCVEHWALEQQELQRNLNIRSCGTRSY